MTSSPLSRPSPVVPSCPEAQLCLLKTLMGTSHPPLDPPLRKPGVFYASKSLHPLLPEDSSSPVASGLADWYLPFTLQFKGHLWEALPGGLSVPVPNRRTDFVTLMHADLPLWTERPQGATGHLSVLYLPLWAQGTQCDLQLRGPSAEPGSCFPRPMFTPHLSPLPRRAKLWPKSLLRAQTLSLNPLSKLLCSPLCPWPVSWASPSCFPGQGCLESLGLTPPTQPRPRSRGTVAGLLRAQALRTTAPTSPLPAQPHVGPRLHPGGRCFCSSLHVFSRSAHSLRKGLPELAHLVHFGNSIWPQTYSTLGGLFNLLCQGSPPLLGTLSLPGSPSPIVIVEGRGGATGKEVRVGCSAPSLPPALLLATLQALSPRD